MLDGGLLMESIGFNPLPELRFIYAELALACKALSAAVAHVGKPEVRLHAERIFSSK